MIILKSESFFSNTALAEFINKNNIKRENIIAITSIADKTTTKGMNYVYYYGDSETKELTHTLLGWD